MSSPGDQSLFQARYTLTSLGIETRFTARGDALRGELDLALHGPLRNPITGEPLTHLSFTVEGDGTLRVDDPPCLKGTRRRTQELVSVAELVEQLDTSLVERVSRVSALCERLQRMGLDTPIDGERVAGVVRVELVPEGIATLEVNETGLVARTLVPAFGDRAPLSLGELHIDFEELADRSDLEFALAGPVARALEQRPRREAAQARPTEIVLDTPIAQPAARPEKKRVPRNQPPSLQELAQRFGASAFPKPGFSVGRPVLVEGSEVRFIAQHTKGRHFEVRLVGKDGPLWQGEIDLENTGPLEEWLPEVLGGAARVEAVDDDPTIDATGGRPELVAGLLPPVSRECWVMDVRVEEDDGVEVRYRGLNVGGATFGAPRVLPKPAFEASYLPAAGGYRLLVRVLEVSPSAVVYQRLDAQRAPVGTPKESPLVVFLANFVAESAAY